MNTTKITPVPGVKRTDLKQCSECRFVFAYDSLEDESHLHYCPNCGRRNEAAD